MVWPTSNSQAQTNAQVGNIPYDYTEEQLIDIFRQIGPVNSFRLVFDNTTGRCKGYGFCEYLDASSAQSAVRNLDGYDIGNRQIRVAFSDHGNTGGGGGGSHSSAGQSSVQAQNRFMVPPPGAPGGLPFPPPPAIPQQNPGMLPPLPIGTAPAAGLTAEDAISKTLQVFPPMQLLDIVTQFKQLATGNPAQAEQLLQQSPQLSYAVLQALLLMNLVDAGVLTRVIAGGPAVPPPVAAPVQQAPAAQIADPRLARASATPIAQASSPAPSSGTAARAQTASPAMPAAAGQIDPQKEYLAKQIMSMTDAQIQAFPVDQRNQILFVRKQIQDGTFVMTA